MSGMYPTRRRLWGVGLALALLLVCTVAASQLPLGRFQIVLGLGFASAKAVLIGLYFMNLRHEAAVIRVVVVGVFLWLSLLVGLVVIDDRTREHTPGMEQGAATGQTHSAAAP